MNISLIIYIIGFIVFPIVVVILERWKRNCTGMVDYDEPIFTLAAASLIWFVSVFFMFFSILNVFLTYKKQNKTKQDVKINSKS